MAARLIYNANAGQKIGIVSHGVGADDLRALLDQYGLDAEIVATEAEGEARAQARDAVARGFDTVIAAGGDGTAGLVAGELLATDTALGILPLGTVMNMARMLDIPRDLDGAAAVLVAGNRRAIDVGRANGQLFFESGSVGMIAPIFREVQRMERQRVRAALAALRAVARYRPARMVIHLDDRVITTRSLLVTVSNGPYTGMALTVAPDALVDDGLFDVQVFRRFGRLGLAFYLTSIMAGRTRYTPRIRTYRSATVRIEGRHPLPSRADGHDLGFTPVTFELLPGMLNVIAA